MHQSFGEVIPMFNGADGLGGELEPPHRQTEPPAEVRVVGDGSDDDAIGVTARHSVKLAVIRPSANHAFASFRTELEHTYPGRGCHGNQSACKVLAKSSDLREQDAEYTSRPPAGFDATVCTRLPAETSRAHVLRMPATRGAAVPEITTSSSMPMPIPTDRRTGAILSMACSNWAPDPRRA